MRTGFRTVLSNGLFLWHSICAGQRTQSVLYEKCFFRYTHVGIIDKMGKNVEL